MAPIREYLCKSCGHQFDEMVRSQNPEDYRRHECRCGESADMLFSSISNVQGVSLSGARPKNRAAGKTYTGGGNG